MGWDAHLECQTCGSTLGDWNYTHNTSRMVYESGAVDGKPSVSWWAALEGMEGPDGAAFLDGIIRALDADPERFIALNPPNGWGDYEFLGVLRSMRAAVPEFPTKWWAAG